MRRLPEKHSRSRGVTATDVARRAGVSQSTVSRVFSAGCKVKVNEDARRRVLQAAEELGYVPNAIAQIMTSGRSGIIGIVVSDYYNLFYYNMLRLLTNCLIASGFRAMTFTASPEEDVNTLLRELYQYQVDGVIITSSALSHRVPHRWTERGMPVVLLNGYLPGMEISTVQSDQFGSGEQMADYLVRVGHRRFAYVSSENSPHKNYLPRQEGFLSGLARRGVTDCLVIPAGYSYESGLEAGRQLLREQQMPDGIFCSGDLNALGVIDALRGRPELVLGRDISVTGYDAPILEQLEGYSLTGMTQQVEQLSRDCVALVRRLVEAPDTPPQVITHPMKLTVRGSSRPLETPAGTKT